MRIAPNFDYYGSVGDVLAKLGESRTPGAGNSSTRAPDPRFHGEGGTFDAAREWLAHGWDEGARRAEEIAAQLAYFKPVGVRKRWTKDIGGVYPIIPAYLAGDPRAMLNRRKKSRQQGGIRHVELVIPAAFPARINFDVALDRGLAYVALVDALEARGIRARITLAYPSERPSFTLVIRVKEYEQPLILNDLAFTVGHPCMLRRITFGLMERTDLQNKSILDATRMAYGSVRDEITLNNLPPGSDSNAVFFKPLMFNQGETVEDHLDALVEQLPEEIQTLVTEEYYI